ncbi:MAG: DUF4878 domain-containing protein [Bacteroidales bacterium]|nr:DUF4878 domain-containing protein [Bacteroidales bacterium]
MNRILKYLIVAAGMVMAAGCGGNNAEEEKAMEPEAAVETFCRAVAAGDFETAGGLCDTVSMKGYLDEWRKVWNDLQKEDSSALAIASSMLSGAEIEVIRTERSGEKRTVLYRIEAEGNSKTRTATVKNEEGEWKVEEISDASLED